MGISMCWPVRLGRMRFCLFERGALRVAATIATGILAVVMAGASAYAGDGAYGGDGKMAPIKIELPPPYFGGTPLDYFGPNLEKPNYKKRPPFMAPSGTSNAAKGKSVSSSDPDPGFGKLDFLVDGDKDYKRQSLLGLGKGLQWIQIDLGSVHNVHAIVLWHFHEGERVYFDVTIQVADDAAFTENVRTVFSNDHDNSSGLGVGKDKEYIESYKGKLVDAKGVPARYVRFYSKGNTTDDMNHYVEAEVFGEPAG